MVFANFDVNDGPLRTCSSHQPNVQRGTPARKRSHLEDRGWVFEG